MGKTRRRYKLKLTDFPIPSLHTNYPRGIGPDAPQLGGSSTHEEPPLKSPFPGTHIMYLVQRRDYQSMPSTEQPNLEQHYIHELLLAKTKQECFRFGGWNGSLSEVPKSFLCNPLTQTIIGQVLHYEVLLKSSKMSILNFLNNNSFITTMDCVPQIHTKSSTFQSYWLKEEFKKVVTTVTSQWKSAYLWHTMPIICCQGRNSVTRNLIYAQKDGFKMCFSEAYILLILNIHAVCWKANSIMVPFQATSVWGDTASLIFWSACIVRFCRTLMDVIYAGPCSCFSHVSAAHAHMFSQR